MCSCHRKQNVLKALEGKQFSLFYGPHLYCVFKPQTVRSPVTYTTRKIKHVRSASADHKSHFLIEPTSEHTYTTPIAVIASLSRWHRMPFVSFGLQIEHCLISVCSHVAPRGMLSTSAKLSTPAQH